MKFALENLKLTNNRSGLENDGGFRMYTSNPYYTRMINRQTGEYIITKMFGHYYDALDYAEKSKNEFVGYMILDFNDKVIDYEV